MAESLRAFILKAEVIKLYRNFWRTVKEAPSHTRGELEEQVRQGFQQHRNVQELYQVKYHLSDGRVQLKQLREVILLGR